MDLAGDHRPPAVVVERILAQGMGGEVVGTLSCPCTIVPAFRGGRALPTPRVSLVAVTEPAMIGPRLPGGGIHTANQGGA
jgi:hypothetical protein